MNTNSITLLFRIYIFLGHFFIIGKMSGEHGYYYTIENMWEIVYAPSYKLKSTFELRFYRLVQIQTTNFNYYPRPT